MSGTAIAAVSVAFDSVVCAVRAYRVLGPTWFLVTRRVSEGPDQDRLSLAHAFCERHGDSRRFCGSDSVVCAVPARIASSAKPTTAWFLVTRRVSFEVALSVVERVFCRSNRVVTTLAVKKNADEHR